MELLNYMKGEELRILDSNAGAANGSGRDQIADDGVIGAYASNNPYDMDTSPQNNEMMHQAANKSVSKTTSKPKRSGKPLFSVSTICRMWIVPIR